MTNQEVPEALPSEEKKYQDELDLKWAEIEIKREELRLKGEELRTARGKGPWMSPTQATLLVAVIGLIGTAIGACYTAHSELQVERNRDANTIQLAKQDLQSKLIIQAENTDSNLVAFQKLLFLAQIKFIPDPNNIFKTLSISEFPATLAAGTGAAINPAPGPGAAGTNATAVAPASSSAGAGAANVSPNPLLNQPSVTTERDYDRYGDDYFSTSSSVDYLASCQALCLQDSKCKAYSYLPAGVTPHNWEVRLGPTCWLKNGVPIRKAYTGLISGVRQD